ncbi:PI-PLC domain-containing protein [Chitinophaga agri]|uniref:Phosphatidylinositol diacylglycerol-lyase n=1 Tax=Chitinophaga agri TaxID=2703787 RepID=A0A6B9ZBC8_9BACT|nr:hypothetical protein [Chitinophaga agri]QHS59139.1 hypothetical protein GWR21_05890 [Chitinophaga agri]
MANNLSSWMSNPIIQRKKLSQIVIPGTHDSGTYGLTDSLSTVSYSNIAFLWQLSKQSAPANGSFPWTGSGTKEAPTYYVGPEMYDYIINVVKQMSQSQDSSDSIYAQLNNGIRFFDLRLYYDETTTPNDYYLQHGLRGPSLTTVLDDIHQFISEGQQEKPVRQELIFLQISHTNFSDDAARRTQEVVKKFVSILNQKEENNIYTVHAPHNLNTFFTDKSLSEITGWGTKVIILNADHDKYSYNDPLVFDGNFHATDSSTGVDTVADLWVREQEALNNLSCSQKSPWGISWVMTPHASDLISYVMKTLMVKSVEPPPLAAMALAANPSLPAFIQYAAKPNSFNLITCDWYRLPGTPNGTASVVEIAMALSAM